MHKHRCPFRALIAAGLIRLGTCCSGKSHGVIRCFSVCKERVNNGCTIRSCCSSIRVLPGFPCVGVSLILGVGDRPSVRSGTSAGGISRPGPRLDHCVLDRLAVRIILRKACECGFPCFRFAVAIGCTVKGHSLGSCCTVLIKCKRHFCTCRCCRRAICILPCFGRTDLCRHLCVNNHVARFYRRCISGICVCLTHSVIDLSSGTDFVLGKVLERCFPGTVLTIGVRRSVQFNRGCHCTIRKKCNRDLSPCRRSISSVCVHPLLLSGDIQFNLAVSDRITGRHAIRGAGSIPGISGTLFYSVRDFLCCTVFDCVLRESDERCCPFIRFAVCIGSAIQSDCLTCCLSVGKQFEDNGSTIRSSCGSVRILPLLCCRCCCRLLCVGDRGTACNRVCRTGSVSRPSSGFCYRIRNKSCPVRFILG